MTEAVSGQALRGYWRLDIPKEMAASKTVEPTSKLVWMVLADMARGGNQVFFSVDTIAERAGVSGRTARECLRELEGVGWLKTEHRVGSTSVYSPMIWTPAESAGGGRKNLPGRAAEFAAKSEHLSPNNGGGEEAPPSASPQRFRSQDPERHFADAAAARIVDRFVTLSREAWGDEVPPDGLDLKAARENHVFLSTKPRWLEEAIEYHGENDLPHTLVSLIDTVRRGKLDQPREREIVYKTADQIEAEYQENHRRLHGTL